MRKRCVITIKVCLKGDAVRRRFLAIWERTGGGLNSPPSVRRLSVKERGQPVQEQTPAMSGRRASASACPGVWAPPVPRSGTDLPASQRGRRIETRRSDASQEAWPRTVAFLQTNRTSSEICQITQKSPMRKRVTWRYSAAFSLWDIFFFLTRRPLGEGHTYSCSPLHLRG